MKQIARIDHIQIAAPIGCEADARRFYGDLLGLVEIDKPEPLRSRGGCWFECGDQQLHIGVERDFTPAKKAHPAFAVIDLDALRERMASYGIAVIEDRGIPGVHRFYTEDPWGNRLEFMQQ